MQTYVTLLRRRPGFRTLWLAQLVSLAGDWFNAIATVMLVNRYGNTGLAVSVLFVARYLPPFFVGPVAGVIADRFNRKTILIASDLLRAGIVLGFLLVDRPERVWLAYALSAAQFVVSAFFEPARSAIVPELVEPDELVAANTLAGVTYSTMLVVGAAIGGAVAAIFGAPIALVVDSVSYGLSALLLWRIVSARPAAHETAAGGWHDLVEGMRFTRRHPEVGPVVLVKGLGQLGSVDVIAAALSSRVFSLGQDGGGSLGLLWAAFGVGTILGPPVGNLFHRNTAETIRRAILAGYAAIAIGWLLIGVSPWLPLTVAAFALRGLGGSLNWVQSDILIQMSAPGRILGRVFSINLAFFTLVVSVSAVISGALLDLPGVDPGRLSLWFGLASLLPLAGWWSATRRPVEAGLDQEKGIP